ncbi:vegetative incompatibility protein het-e-1 [Colletotrichum musicola]|uniref:Vegetative incompatibility protein het-e-1 n=1 Tax=Colletotrichum musicola TaxID=2175873 RepID=A0A8H6K2W7_9PEZI|nr:vegetative incompatibility protein het-e-1 [Colletotrichum musicola]
MQELSGHSREVMLFTFSSDGQLIASASLDRTVRIWRVATGTLIHTLPNHGWPKALAFSTSGPLLASASTGLIVQLWNGESGAHNKTFQDIGHSDISPVAFSPDIQRMASFEADERIHLWDLEDGKVLAILGGHTETTHLVFSPDNKRLASASYKGVRIWDLETFDLVRTLEGQVGPVVFSSDSRLLASGTVSNVFDKEIRLFDTTSGEWLSTINSSDRVDSLSWVDNTLASKSVHGPIQLWDTSICRRQPSLNDHDVKIRTIGVSPNGRMAVSLLEDGRFHLRDLVADSSKMIRSSSIEHVPDIIFSLDNKLFGFSGPLSAEIWKVESGARHQTVANRPDHRAHLPRAVAYSSDAMLVALAFSDNIKLRDSMTGTYLHTLKGHRGMVCTIAFSADSRILASWSFDNTIRLWHTATGTCRQTLRNAFDSIHVGLGYWRLVFSPDSEFIAAVDGKLVKWWDTATGFCHQLKNATNARRAAFSPNKRFLAVVTGNHRGGYSLDLHDLAAEKDTKTYLGRVGAVDSIVFSRNSEFIAVGFGYSLSGGSHLELWSTSTHLILHRLRGYARLLNIKFSPDGQTIAASFLGGKVLLWSTSTGRQLQSIKYDQGSIREFTVLPDEVVLFVSQHRLGEFHNPCDPWPVESRRYPIGGCIGLDVAEEWIMSGSNKLVWLPPEYRPRREKEGQVFWATRGSAIFVASDSGLIRIEVS